MLGRLRGADADRELDRMLSVEGTTPEERELGAGYFAEAIGLCIPMTMVVFALIAMIGATPSVALRIIITPLIFFFIAYIWMLYRKVPAGRDLKRWTLMREAGKEQEYSPDDDSYSSIPVDRDFLLPLVLALVIGPALILSGLLTY